MQNYLENRSVLVDLMVENRTHIWGLDSNEEVTDLNLQM